MGEHKEQLCIIAGRWGRGVEICTEPEEFVSFSLWPLSLIVRDRDSLERDQRHVQLVMGFGTFRMCLGSLESFESHDESLESLESHESLESSDHFEILESFDQFWKLNKNSVFSKYLCKRYYWYKIVKQIWKIGTMSIVRFVVCICYKLWILIFW